MTGDAQAAVLEALGEFGAGLLVKGSPGQGNWAAVPWISVFDPAITTIATRGYYLVYLFHASEPVVYLSLNQGTTTVREEFGARTREILKDRADLMRKRIENFAEALPVKAIELGSMGRLPGDYVAGHALGTSYMLDALPDEVSLRVDLQAMVRAYRALTVRGGTDADVETQSEVADEFDLPKSTTVIETRKYAYHRKVERSQTATKKAKEFHGTRCQACELSFPERYGDIGAGFIEAGSRGADFGTTRATSPRTRWFPAVVAPGVGCHGMANSARVFRPQREQPARSGVIARLTFLRALPARAPMGPACTR